jgi:hypothetical protein
MKKDRIYIDTSIVGGFFDDEFESETKLLFKRLENNEVIFIVSDLLEVELEMAPERVKNLLNQFPDAFFERVTITLEVGKSKNTVSSSQFSSQEVLSNKLYKF